MLIHSLPFGNYMQECTIETFTEALVWGWESEAFTFMVSNLQTSIISDKKYAPQSERFLSHDQVHVAQTAIADSMYNVS